MHGDVTLQQTGAGPSIRDQIRTEIQTSVREAVRQNARAAEEGARAAQEGARAAAAAAVQAGEVPPGTSFRVGANGEIIPLEGGTVVDVRPTQGEAIAEYPSVRIQPEIPQGAVDMAIAFFAMIAFIIVGLPIARAFARRMDRRGTVAAVAPGQAAQLQQIQTAVEAMAVEVERISENQRYVTRLLADGTAAGVPVDARPLEQPRQAR